MEYLDIVDENGIPTGRVEERAKVHAEGLRHRTAHVWIGRKDPETGRLQVIMQKRSQQKDSYPGCYDISSAGHVPAGVDYLPSALRELKEEGAVASVCCSYLNAEGQEVGQSIMERSIGLTLKELKKSRLIAAAIGASKVKAIDAALKSGYIDVLVTNLVTAKGLLEDTEENMKEE